MSHDLPEEILERDRQMESGEVQGLSMKEVMATVRANLATTEDRRPITDNQP